MGASLNRKVLRRLPLSDQSFRFFQPVDCPAAVSVPKAQSKAKVKAKPKGLVQTELHLHG